MPRRIISVSPSVTEILYGVGAFDRLVAVSAYCTYPPAVKNLPRVGGWQNSNLERIAAFHPDLVILTDAQSPFLEDKLQQLGLRSLIVPTRSLNDVFVAIETIGRATGREAQAMELARLTRAALDAVRNQTKKLPQRSVLFVVDRTPGTLRDMYVATQGSFLVELIGIGGGESVAAPTRNGYGKISKEAVLTLNPEVIIDMVHGSKGRLGEHPELVWHDLPELRAVRDRRVYPVRDDFIPHASQFVADTAKLFARLIHPNAFRGGKE
ncbi:MAG: ABC transporter substrate-binding protein [Acidobacteria bacterium]|nr:ABC transporter substrate-binding protein [Acidobacteriota bacterium]